MRPHPRPMRWRALLCAALLLLAACSCGRAPAPHDAAAVDTEAIRAVLDEQVAAWNRGDLAAFMEGYWQSDSLTFYSGGDIANGWQAAHDRYVQRYQSEGREMGRLRFELHDVTALGPDAALVRGAWHLSMRESEPHGLFSLVLRNIAGSGWRIVHDHSSVAG